MGKLTKNQKLAAEKIEAGKAYSLKEAASLVKEITFTKFDASLDIDVRLGVDPRKANQMVRGVVSLPHGTGKEVRVLVLCTPCLLYTSSLSLQTSVRFSVRIPWLPALYTPGSLEVTMPGCSTTGFSFIRIL